MALEIVARLTSKEVAEEVYCATENNEKPKNISWSHK